MPLVDDDTLQRSHAFAHLGIGQQQRQALRGRDQHRWEALSLPRFDRCRGIAGTNFNRPLQTDPFQRGTQRSRRIGGQRTERR